MPSKQIIVEIEGTRCVLNALKQKYGSGSTIYSPSVPLSFNWKPNEMGDVGNRTFKQRFKRLAPEGGPKIKVRWINEKNTECFTFDVNRIVDKVEGSGTGFDVRFKETYVPLEYEAINSDRENDLFGLLFKYDKEEQILSLVTLEMDDN